MIRWYLLIVILALNQLKVFSQVLDSGYFNVELTIPEVALLDLEPDIQLITLELAPVSNAGEKLQSPIVNSSKWINYSSSISNASPLKQLSVQVISGQIPLGTSLQLKADNYSGSGMGQLGVSSDTIVLSHSPQTIINNIGGAYTGDGNLNGHQLHFILDIIDFSLLDFDYSDTIILTYTLTDN